LVLKSFLSLSAVASAQVDVRQRGEFSAVMASRYIGGERQQANSSASQEKPMRMLTLVSTLLVVGHTAVTAWGADLTKIDRTIAKEPAYKSKPKYCLLVFGPGGENTSLASAGWRHALCGPQR
jgi:hypothetical protein